MAPISKPVTAAISFGVEVPDSPFLNEMRIKRLNAERYEGQEVAGALHVVKEGDRVLELGAGIGFVGAAIAKNCKLQEVRSFEANPELIPHINALYKHNKLDKMITVSNAVLLTSPNPPKTIDFFVANSYLGSSLEGRPGRNSTKITIPTETYTSVQKTLKPNVLIMDIEGGELDFLEHADISDIRAIVIELHPKAYGVDAMRKCKKIMRDAGLHPNQELSTRTVWVCEKDT